MKVIRDSKKRRKWDTQGGAVPVLTCGYLIKKVNKVNIWEKT